MRFVSGHAFIHAESALKMKSPSAAGFVEWLNSTGCEQGWQTAAPYGIGLPHFSARSEEHTSELQSHSDLVCRLLLEKTKPRSAQSAIALDSVHRPPTSPTDH